MITITINEKECGVIFGYTSFKRFQRSLFLNQKIFLSEGKLTDEAYVEILHAGYENHCLDNRLKVELSIDDIARWIDVTYKTDEGKALINDIFKQWEQSTDVQDMIKEQEKKSQLAGTSSPSTSTE